MASEQCILPAGGPLSLTRLGGLELLEVPAKDHRPSPIYPALVEGPAAKSQEIGPLKVAEEEGTICSIWVSSSSFIVLGGLCLSRTPKKWGYCSAPVELGWFEDGGKMFWDERRVFRGV